MKVPIEKIKKANIVFQFLLFLVIILFVCIQGVIFFINQIHYSSNGSVDIVDNSDDFKIEKSIHYKTIIKDFYVFSLESNVIESSENNLLSRKSPSYGSKNEIVNLFFISNITKKENQLFPNNKLILSFQFLNEDITKGKILSKNIYAVVENDTNNDKKLSDDDKISLYVSNYNGKQLQLIGTDVYEYKIIKDDLVLFVEKRNTKKFYIAYNINTGNKEEIKSADSEMGNKRFSNVLLD